jgi:hypothetical protein
MTISFPIIFLYLFSISVIVFHFAVNDKRFKLEVLKLYIMCTGTGKSRDSYSLADRGSRVRFPARAENFSLHYRVQNGSGVHPASYQMGTGGFSLGVKRPGHEADHSPPSSAELQYVFMAWYSVKHRDNFAETGSTDS